MSLFYSPPLANSSPSSRLKSSVGYTCSLTFLLAQQPSQESDLEACLGFHLPGGEVGVLTLTHQGPDAWQPEWIRVLLDDSTYLMCYDGQVGTADGPILPKILHSGGGVCRGVLLFQWGLSCRGGGGREGFQNF